MGLASCVLRYCACAMPLANSFTFRRDGIWRLDRIFT
jgi:hypothetical protein